MGAASGCGRWTQRKLAKAPRAVRIAAVVVIVLTTFMMTNLIYHVIRKPTELFFFIGHKLDKQPAETWRRMGLGFAGPYRPAFRSL